MTKYNWNVQNLNRNAEIFMISSKMLKISYIIRKSLTDFFKILIEMFVILFGVLYFWPKWSGFWQNFRDIDRFVQGFRELCEKTFAHILSPWDKSQSGTPPPLDLKKQPNLSHNDAKMSKCFFFYFFSKLLVNFIFGHKMKNHTWETSDICEGKKEKLRFRVIIYTIFNWRLH